LVYDILKALTKNIKKICVLQYHKTFLQCLLPKSSVNIRYISTIFFMLMLGLKLIQVLNMKIYSALNL